MSRYDGLIIPRSYSEYLNKTDSATLSQMLQHLSGLWSHAVAAGDNKPVTSDAVYGALAEYTAIPYLSFNPTNKVWAWNRYNEYNTSKPIVNGQLVAIFLDDNLNNEYWSDTTTGVVPYMLQNTSGEKSAGTKCIGIVLDAFIDIIS